MVDETNALMVDETNALILCTGVKIKVDINVLFK
jgi:hypothetical protein